MRIVAVAGVMVTVTTTGAVTVTLAEPETVGISTLAAVTATVAGDAGAVYSPIVSIQPTTAFPPPTPLTDHVTA